MVVIYISSRNIAHGVKVEKPKIYIKKCSCCGKRFIALTPAEVKNQLKYHEEKHRKKERRNKNGL